MTPLELLANLRTLRADICANAKIFTYRTWDGDLITLAPSDRMAMVDRAISLLAKELAQLGEKAA